MLDRGQPLSLWGSWWNAIQSLRPAFSRLRAFMWFATIVAGMTVRTELLGVTSFVRALNLRPNLYNLLRKHFHSSAVKLDRLSAQGDEARLTQFFGLTANRIPPAGWPGMILWTRDSGGSDGRLVSLFSAAAPRRPT